MNKINKKEEIKRNKKTGSDFSDDLIDCAVEKNVCLCIVMTTEEQLVEYSVLVNTATQRIILSAPLPV